MSWEIIFSLGILAATKFLFAPFVAEGVFQIGYFDAILVTTIGGFVGIILFTFFGEGVIWLSDKIVYGVKRLYKTAEAISSENANKKKFTAKNKLIVRVKKRFGLIGISFLTPCIISIPFGCFVGVAIYKSKTKVMIYCTGWLLFWTVVLNTLAQFFGFSKYFI
jgi:hypothetical protein